MNVTLRSTMKVGLRILVVFLCLLPTRGFGQLLDINSLTDRSAVVLAGSQQSDGVGRFISGVGDVNGDGVNDVAVRARAGNRGRAVVNVIYGSGEFVGRYSLDEVGLATAVDGFKIVSPTAPNGFGFVIPGIGDINGDGLDDIIVNGGRDTDDMEDDGSVDSDGNENPSILQAHVIFGARESATRVDVRDLDGDKGFTLLADRIDADELFSAAIVGDFNGDGFADFILSRPAWRGFRGEAVMIFGKGEFAAHVDINDLDDAEFVRLRGQERGDGVGWRIAGLGDINRDGYDDVAITTTRSPHGVDRTGEVIVLFGNPTLGGNVDISDLDGSNGFVLEGKLRPNSGSELIVSGIGDVNADGIDDFAVSNGRNEVAGNEVAGEVFVYFGGRTFRAKSALTKPRPGDGVYIGGEFAFAQIGAAINGTGDINADGVDDFLVSATSILSTPQTDSEPGRVYVVFGSSSIAQEIVPSALNGFDGFELRGAQIGDRFGVGSAYVGDVNADSIDDIFVGADDIPLGALTFVGEAYVVYGDADIGTGGPLPTLLVTQALVEPGNYGWVLFPDGAKQWVDVDCRAALESTGFSTTILEWPRIAAYPDRSPVACDEIHMTPDDSPDDPSDDDPTDSDMSITLVTTPDRIAPGDYGWVIFADDTKQWVDPVCRSRIESIETVMAMQWVEIDRSADRTPLSCDAILALITEVSFPRVAVTPDRIAAGDYGWALFADGTKQWVDPACRADLERRGLETDVLTWDEISDYSDGIVKDCGDITPGDTPTLVILVTPDRQAAGNYGWVVFEDNTKQWIDGDCRDALADRGVTVEAIPWVEIAPIVDNAQYQNCEALLSM